MALPRVEQAQVRPDRGWTEVFVKKEEAPPMRQSGQPWKNRGLPRGRH